MDSACVEAKADPAWDVPAWKRKGVRWGDGSTMCRVFREKYLPLWLIWRILSGSAYESVSGLGERASGAQDPSQSLVCQYLPL